jgi:hypothetical protein
LSPPPELPGPRTGNPPDPVRGPGGSPGGNDAAARCHPCLYLVKSGVMTDDFDPVMLAEIALMTDPPMSRQHAAWLMGQEGAPEPVGLARGKVWRRAEAAEYVRAHEERIASGEAGFDPAQPRGHGGHGSRWARGPAEEPSPAVLELREWIASGRAREIRLAAGRTCKAVAAELGVAESTVGRWENGRQAPGDRDAAAWHALLTQLAEGDGG